MTNNKGNTALKTPAQTGLEELETESARSEKSSYSMMAPAEMIAENAATVSNAIANTAATSSDAFLGDEELESAGSGPRVGRFYVIDPEGSLKDNQAEIKPGQIVKGTYEGSYTSGEYDSRTHKIREAADGVVSGLPAAGALNKGFQFVPRGTKVAVIFEGMDGKFNNFDVLRPPSLNRRIEANDPSLPKNYDWTPANYGKGKKR
jgi:hypothetical protein